jgi:anti-sigma factor ChrR (cupin superfamily)
MQARAELDLKPEINADCEQLVVMDTTKMPWEPTEHPGVWRKLLERVNDPKKGRETMLMRFDPGTTLPTWVETTRTDMFILEGSYTDEHGTYGKQTFVRNPAGFKSTPGSKDGCVFYVKRRIPFRENEVRIVTDTTKNQFTPFGHRAGQVQHLYRDAHGIDTSRFGEVFPNSQIAEHDHAMGEETFVVDGCLRDDRGAYTPGMWFRFPSGLPHAPFTKDEHCMMFIREGDLYW